MTSKMLAAGVSESTAAEFLADPAAFEEDSKHEREQEQEKVAKDAFASAISARLSTHWQGSESLREAQG